VLYYYLWWILSFCNRKKGEHYEFFFTGGFCLRDIYIDKLCFICGLEGGDGYDGHPLGRRSFCGNELFIETNHWIITCYYFFISCKMIILDEKEIFLEENIKRNEIRMNQSSMESDIKIQ